MERPLLEPVGINQSQRDRDAIRSIQTDRSDTGRRAESHGGAEGWKREEGGEAAGEPNGANGGFPAWVDFVEEASAWESTVSGEGEHHARVGGDRECSMK